MTDWLTFDEWVERKRQLRAVSLTPRENGTPVGSLAGKGLKGEAGGPELHDPYSLTRKERYRYRRGDW